jgi:Rrf2 family protein
MGRAATLVKIIWFTIFVNNWFGLRPCRNRQDAAPVWQPAIAVWGGSGLVDLYCRFDHSICRPGPNVLTNKGKYGLKAMLHLAKLPEGKSTQAAEIAEANGIPKAFLDTILLDLRKAGFVRSKKGPGGGFMLAKPPSEIRMGYIVRTLDGPIAPIPCARRKDNLPCMDCRDVPNCPVRILMQSVRDAMADVLDRTTLEQMRDQAAPQPTTTENAA